ncbi:MAG: sulfatase-like hydrolase/transferase [Bacteroidota bacterium]
MKAFFKVSITPLKQIAFLFLLYAVLRTLFLFIHFSEWELSFTELISIYLHGLQFDGVTIAFANITYLLIYFLPLEYFLKSTYPFVKKYLFILLNIPFILLNCIDLAYYSFSGKRITADFISTSKDITNQIGSYVIDYWWIVIILLVFIYFLNKIIKHTTSNLQIQFTTKNKLLNLIIWIPFLFLIARGSLNYKPLHNFDANNYVKNINAPLVLNSAFTFIKTLDTEPINELNYFTESELSKIYSPFHKPNNKEQNKKNVVVIVLESFSKEYVGFLNNGNGYTPFLDSLANHSLIFTNFYANGRRSNEGIPAIIAGIPHLMEANFIASNYGSNQFCGLGTYLAEMNYNTSFFHGGVNGTMSFDSFSKLSGFTNYFGKNEYNGKDDDYDGNWGIYDEEYFNFFCNKLNSFKTPFASVFFSLSSHHPYNIPLKHKNKFPKGKSEIHESIGYADYALAQFFKQAKQTEWYKNTLFVITADHTSITNVYYYQTALGEYQIPLLIFSPSDSTIIGSKDILSQQIDILPTVLDYVGYNKNYFAFGNSLFDAEADRFAIQQKNGFQLVYKDFLFQYANDNNANLFDIKNDSLLQNPIHDKNNENYKISERKLKAILQSFNNSLIRNKMKF